MARQNSNNKVDYSALVSNFKANKVNNKDVARKLHYQEMISGELPINMIKWLKANGVNEAGESLRWPVYMEDVLRIQADLRIAEVYTTGVAQLYKGHPNTSHVYTDKGLKLVGDIQLGDYFIDHEGKPTKVIGVHPLGEATTYLVSFKDGSSIEVTDEHLWEWYAPSASTKAAKKGGVAPRRVNTTAELLAYAESLGGFRQVKKSGKLGRYKMAIPALSGPAQYATTEKYPEQIPPYLMGLLVGDGSYGYGTVNITGEEADLKEYLEYLPDCFEYEIKYPKDRTPHISIHSHEGRKKTKTGIQTYLRQVGAMYQTRKDKRIPECYLHADAESRLELLRGLMDADGGVSKTGNGGAFFCSSVEPIADQFLELLRGLGGYGKKRKNVITLNGEKFDSWSIYFSLPQNPFKLKRKAALYSHKSVGKDIKAIENIVPCRVVESTCFTVENERSLYLCPGGIVTHNTISNALVNAYFAQVLGFRTAWCFPKEKLVDTNVPKQHSKILEHFTAIQGMKPRRQHSTSNRLYQLDKGSNTFLGIVTGASDVGGAAASANIVSFTADVVFAEEASQLKQSFISPLISRVEQSISPQQPIRYLGTPGSGTGIEFTIEGAGYDFWPHMVCPHCGEEIVMDVRGCLLKPTTYYNRQGVPEQRYQTLLGTVEDYHRNEQGEPIFACSKCETYLSMEDRAKNYLRCIKTGLDVKTFLEDEVPKKWKKERLKVALWGTALLREKETEIVAKAIIENGMNPEGAKDFTQQQLGIPFTATSASITETQWINACRAPAVNKKQYPDQVKVLGIDQGRSDWYGVIATIHYDFDKISSENLKDFIIDIDDFYCASSDHILEQAAELGVEVGMIDNEPSIYLGAEICEQYGYHMADQQPRQLDDYKAGKAKDAGMLYDCWKIRDQKYGFLILQAFMDGRVRMPERFLQSLNDRSIKSPAKHLRSVSWDSGEALIVKAADDIDHLFFALMFLVSGYAIYLDHPEIMSSVQDFSWV